MKLYSNHKVMAFDVDETICDLHGNPYMDVIEYLKAQSMAGYDIILWSQQGGDHAWNRAHQLGIQSYVTECRTKPSVYVDDLPASAWMEWKKVPIRH